MPQLEQGKLLHKRLIHLLICGMKPVPIAGAVVEFVADWWKFSDELQQAQKQLDLAERVAQLEEAMSITPEQARVIAQAVIAAERQQGLEISEEKVQAVTAIASALPANIRERTQATLRQARRHGTALNTVLPLTDSANNTAQREFYRSLLPTRRPRFQENEAVPYGPPQWRLVQLIGSGGFGEVWEVRHQQLGDQFAVKFCQDSVSAQTLQREAEALKKLRRELPEHPHIVRLVDLQLEQEPYWLAFEYVSGGTLEALMRAKPFTWQEALQIFIPVLQGISAVHSLNIVHRDLKPANILLTEQEVPKITDFGIGKVLIEQEQQQRSLISPSLFVAAGSVGYAPHEQLEGEIAHPADDVYALAVIFWQLLTHSLKSPRYVSATMSQLEAPKEIKDLILNCLERPRSQRPQQAGELLSILQPLVPTEDLQRARTEVETLERELTALDARLSTVVANREVAQQRELEREKLHKQQELSRKELHVQDLSRHAGYQQALAEDKQERAQLEQEASARLARLRQQVEEKRQAWAKAETHQLQPAIDELLTVEKSLAEIEGQYAQEKQVQLAKLEESLQQALQELGEFKPAPRDRFEYEQEYQARLARERAEYEAQRQHITTFWQQAQQEMGQKLEMSYQQTLAPLQLQQHALLALRFEVPPADLLLTLKDYRIEDDKLAFTLLMRNFLALKQVQFAGEVSISRDPARECWQHPELLLPDLVLKLDNGGRLAVVEVGFETAEGTRYLTDQATVVIETVVQIEPRKWWNQWDSNWKTIFNRQINMAFDHYPDDEELKKVLSLQKLDVRDKQFTSLEPLRGLTQLRELVVYNNQLTSLEPLQGLTQLQALSVFGNQVSSLEPLRGLTRLQTLSVLENQLTSLEPLQGLTRLQTLRVWKNQLTNLEPLRGLTQLRTLDVENNQLTSLEPLRGLSQLQELWIGKNQISEIEIAQFRKAVPGCKVHSQDGVVIENDHDANHKEVEKVQLQSEKAEPDKQRETEKPKDVRTSLVVSLGLSVFICVVYLISQGFATVASMMGYHPPIWVELLTSVVFTLGTLTFFAFSWGENSLNLTFVIGLLVSIGYSFPMLPSMLGYHFPVWADLLVSIVFTFGITFTWLRKSKGIRYFVGKVAVVISAIFVIFSIISIITLTGHGFLIVASMMGYNFPIWLDLLAGLAGVVFTLGILDRLWGGNGVSNFFIISLPISMGYGFSMVTSKMGYNPPIWLDGLIGIVFTFVVVFLLAFLEAEKSKNQ